MLRTQKMIVLTGQIEVVKKAAKTISGFKAVTLVERFNLDILKNVYKHNKNLVVVRPTYDMTLNKYRPIVINVISGKTNVEKHQLGDENILEDFPKILNHCGVDAGDHICHDSNSASYKKIKEKCFICKVAKGCPEKPEHILYESDNYIVLPGLGAFFEGYVMIVPKKHVMSMAELAEESDELYEEFLRVLNDMRFILESIYHKKIFVFECGSGKGGAGKHTTSIVHAHVHMAPSDIPVLKSVQKSGLHPGLIHPRSLKNYGEYPYMLYIDQEDTWYIVSDPDTYFPRQHPRQILADHMGLEEGKYNWRVYPYREKMDEIAEEIYSFLRKEYDNLPVWIQDSVKKYI